MRNLSWKYPPDFPQLFETMAPQNGYEQLTNITEVENGVMTEKLQWQDELESSQKPRRWYRSQYISTLFLGVLIGVILSSVSIPIGNAISRAVERNAKKALYRDAKDINEFYGIVQKPVANDPKCGANRHEAKANGCRYDLMASR